MNQRCRLVGLCFLLITSTSLIALDGELGSDRSSVQSVPVAQVQRISDRIDQLVLAQIEEQGQQRNEMSNDEVFLRRIYLDVVGRIPTLNETRSFLNSKDANKRRVLIDQLLDSYGFVSHQYNFWADLLRIKSRQNNVVGQPYIDFIKNSLQSNKPYDEFVTELLVADGPLISRDNGAVGYYLRDRNMPEDNMSNTIRVFLGTRLECAQCHDHPFDDWTQRQYYEMVAFTGGVMTRLSKPDSEYGDQLMKLRRNRDFTQAERAALRRILDPMTQGVQGSGTGLARLPENYMGTDGDDFDIVTAKTMFEGKELVDAKVPTSRRSRNARVNKRFPQRIAGATQIDSRTAYAEWLTGSDNPRFTTVIANRLWKQAMGLGLIEPVDDLNAHTVASNPALMEFLEESMVDLDYDVKQFLRAIYNSKTYQAEAMSKDVVDPNKFNFNGPVVRRMSAEQIWDSLLTLTISDVDRRQIDSRTRYRGLGTGNVYDRYEEIRQMTPDEIVDIAKSYGSNEARAMMRRKMQREARNEQRSLSKEKDELTSRIKKARRDGDRQMLRKLNKEKEALMVKYRQSTLAAQLNRASEIASPAPAGHFLREFGQSDRETIDNSNREPAVTQALSLMNGFLETRIANNQATVLMQNANKAKDNKDAVTTIYLTMLNRKPTGKEATMWSADFRRLPKREAISDLVWTLANTNEFIFVK